MDVCVYAVILVDEKSTAPGLMRTFDWFGISTTFPKSVSLISTPHMVVIWQLRVDSEIYIVIRTAEIPQSTWQHDCYCS